MSQEQRNKKNFYIYPVIIILVFSWGFNMYKENEMFIKDKIKSLDPDYVTNLEDELLAEAWKEPFILPSERSKSERIMEFMDERELKVRDIIGVGPKQEKRLKEINAKYEAIIEKIEQEKEE